MRVDLGRLDVLVPQQILHRAYVVTVLQQVRGEGMTTGIVTLLMIRSPLRFTTGTIPTTARASILFAVCGAKGTKPLS
jgi:hypothetical protein